MSAEACEAGKESEDNQEIDAALEVLKQVAAEAYKAAREQAAAPCSGLQLMTAVAAAGQRRTQIASGSQESGSADQARGPLQMAGREEPAAVAQGEQCMPWEASFNNKKWEVEVKRQVAAYLETKTCEHGCAQQPADSDDTQAEMHDNEASDSGETRGKEVSASSKGRRCWGHGSPKRRGASTKQKPPQDEDIEKNPHRKRSAVVQRAGNNNCPAPIGDSECGYCGTRPVCGGCLQPAHHDCVYWSSSDSRSAAGHFLASEKLTRPGSGEEPKDIFKVLADVEVKNHADAQVRGNPTGWEGVENGDGVICLDYYDIATEGTDESTACLTSIDICPLVSAGGPQEFRMPRKDLVEYHVQKFVEYMRTLGIEGSWLQP